MLKQPSFYLIYIMMTLVAFGGLVVTSQLKEIASFYKVDKVIIAWGLSAAILAIQLNRIVNGVTRPLWGWISDHIGRENAMFTAFLIEGLAVYAWLQTIHRPVMFVLLSSLVLLCLGRDLLAVPLASRQTCTAGHGPPRTTASSTQRKGQPPFFRSGRCLRDAENWILDPGVLRHDRLRHHRRLHGITVAEASGGARHRQVRGNRAFCCIGGSRQSRSDEGRETSDGCGSVVSGSRTQQGRTTRRGQAAAGFAECCGLAATVD